MFTALNLILDCPGLELAVAVHRGLPTRRPLPCIPCVPEYICIVVLRELLYTASLPKLLAQFLATVTQQLVDKASSYLYTPDLLYKPILIAYPCLNKLIYVSVLLGYIDSVIDKVLILPLK